MSEVVQERVVVSRGGHIGEQKAFKVYYVMYYILTLIEALLAIRFLFRLLGANPATGFVSFINALTAPLIAPFRGIFPITSESRSVFDPSVLVAMAIYALVFYGGAQLLRIMTANKPSDIQHPTV